MPAITLSFGRIRPARRCRTPAARPWSPTAFGRWKIQFCHADSRAKILLSSVSGPPKRSEASMPVSASGEKAARSSMAMRTSSSQSMSSGVNVTSPASAAAAASRSSPMRPFRSSTRPGSSRNRLASRLSPLTASDRRRSSSPVSRTAAGGAASPSRAPSSMYERSAARASSSRVPVKQEPGSISAKIERDDTSSRFSVRLQIEPDLAHEPVAPRARGARGRAPRRGRPRRSCAAPRGRSPPR